MKKFFIRLCLVIGLLVAVYATYFLIVRNMDKKLVQRGIVAAPDNLRNAPRLLPSSFLHGQRFYIKMRAADGDTLLAFGDSGGGICMIMKSVAERLGLGSEIKTGLLKGVMPMKYIPFSAVVADAAMPKPAVPTHLILRTPFSRVTEPFLLMPPEDDELRFMMQSMTFDIFLGQNYFMDKALTIDYPRQQIWANTPLSPADEGKPGVQRLGFKKNEAGHKLYGHARMRIEVDGEVIEVLFDTGASFVLSDTGKKDFHTSEKTMGGSFIAASLFDKWRQAHPDWKYYPRADWKQDIIEVPVVRIGGQEAGPVLFARRPDEAWSVNMINTMDKVVRGAIGGSALQYFKVVVDYNSELIRLERM